ncbi:MAG: acetyl-CoA acetyltransferase [Chloroflexi bacterium]|nr:acetyl-CoA acetyltransferase [Chloroflexota bacterium]
MESIRDRVAIIGMGTTKVGERWEAGHEDLLFEACSEALADAKIEPRDIDAGYVGGVSATQTLNRVLKLDYIPVSGMENACSTGADVFRNAAFAVASGMYDIVIAAAAGKQKDAGTTGIDMAGDPSTVGMEAMVHNGSVPRHFGLYATRYMHHYGYTFEQLKYTLARIAVKNHHNGTLNPKAHFQKEITMEDAINAPFIAWPLGLYDCCANIDGGACAILARPEVARRIRDDYVLVKGIGLSSGWREGRMSQKYNFTMFPENVAAAEQAYGQAGIKDPVAELSHVQLHDAFTVNELVDYEDVGIAPRGKAPHLVKEGYFEMDGKIPVNTDGGLKCTGHPVPATGLKQLNESYHQVQGTAGPRQVKNVRYSLAHSQGGLTGSFSSLVTILGPRD